MTKQENGKMTRLFQLFKTAVEEERKAQEMYKEAMDLCQDSILRETLKAFYEDEIRHEHELMEQYDKIRRLLKL